MIDFEKIASMPEFQSAPREKQAIVRDLYFKHYLADKTPPENMDRAQRDFVYGEREPVISTLTPEREEADKLLMRRGLEWGADTLGIPFEPSRALKSEEGARAVVEVAAREAGMKPGEFREGPQALNQAAASFADAALWGLPGAMRKEVTGGDGLAPKATTSSEKITSGVGELGGFILGPASATRPIAKLTAPAVKYAIPQATNLLERAASGVATQAPALASAFAARNVGEALQQPTLGKAGESMGRAAGEGLATGTIFGAAGAIQNRIARIATGLVAMEAERATGLKAPIFDDRPLEEKAFDIAQTLFFLWSKGGDKVLDQAEATIKRKPGTEAQKQLPAPAPPPMAAEPGIRIHLHEPPPTITVRDVPPEPPGPPLALVGRRQAVIPPPEVRLSLAPPGGEYRGPVLGEGFEMTQAEPRAPVVEQKRRPAAESANAFQEALNTAQSPQGMALLKSRLAAEQEAAAAAPVVDRVRLAAEERQRQMDEMAKTEEAAVAPENIAPAVAPAAKIADTIESIQKKVDADKRFAGTTVRIDKIGTEPESTLPPGWVQITLTNHPKIKEGSFSVKGVNTDAIAKKIEEESVKWGDNPDYVPPETMVAPAAEPALKNELTPIQYHFESKVAPALKDFFDVVESIGKDRLIKNRIMPEGDATAWLESVMRQKPTWDRGRKVGNTGIDMLSQKGLWPIGKGNIGEQLRKNMLAAIRAIRGAPGYSTDWFRSIENGINPFAPATKPAPAVKEAAKEPWQMTRDEFRYAENKPKVDAIQAAISQGKRIVNATQWKATQLTNPEHISIDKNGDVRIAAGNKRVALTDPYVDAMANQAGFELPSREDTVYHHAEVEKALSEGKAVPPEVLKDYPDLQSKAEPEAPAPLTPPASGYYPRMEKAAALTKSRPEPQATTLRGAIKALGGVNPLNFKGEFREAPTATKFLLKRSGTPIDLAEQRLKEDGWLGKDESLAMVLRDKENLRRGKVAGEGVAKREQDLTDQERQVKKEMEYEPEAPPDGDYIPMRAEDLPLGKKLTLIAGKSARGWDEFTVKEKDEFGVTLVDGETLNVAPGEQVEVRKDDLPAKAEGVYSQPKTPVVAKARHWSVSKKDDFSFDRLGGMTSENNPQATDSAKLGLWFTEQSTPISDKQNVANEAGLTFKNPLVLTNANVPTVDVMGDQIQDAKQWLMNEVERAGGGEKLRVELQAKGYDGIVLEDSEFDNAKSYVVFDKGQIKAEKTAAERPTLVLQGEKQMPKVQAEMRTKGKALGKAQQGGIEFGAPQTPKSLELVGERAGAKEAAGAEIVKKRLAEEGWKAKTDKEGKSFLTFPGKGSVSGDEAIGWFAFDQKGRIIGKGNIVDGFKRIEDAKAAVAENAKPKVDAKEDIGSMTDRMRDADLELSSARKAARILLNEHGAVAIDIDALKKGIKGLRANLPKKDIGLITQGFGLPTWVADRYPKSAGKIQEVIDNRFRNKNMIRNEYYRELLDSWEGMSKADKERVGEMLWRGDQMGKALGPKGLAKLTPEQRKAYEKTREILDYIWYEDRPELMRSMGMPNNEIAEYYQQSGSRGGYMPHERKGRYFGRVIDPTVPPGGDRVVYRKHFDDFLLTLTGKNIGAKQALVKGRLESDFPGKLIEIGENQKAMAEGGYNDVSPEATQELIDASMKYMNATPGQKADLKVAMRHAVADVFKVRGFGEHFMKRKDIPGFDTSNWQDAVLNYVSSWAGYKSKLMAAREMWDAWGDVDWKGIPKLREYVSKQVKDTFANETFADRAVDTARGILFRQYLSGVLKSAVLNLTQPFIATIPRLTTETHWSGTKVSAEMAKSAKDIIASIGTTAREGMTRRQTAQADRSTKEENMGIRRARENGIIGSQMTEELLGRAAGKFGSNFRKVDNFLGWAFANAELFNREVTYRTAFRIAKNEKGMNFEDAAKFAETIVDQTQFRYGKTNLPPIARGEHWAAKGTRAAYAFRHYPNNLFHLWGKLSGSGAMGAAGIAKSLFALGAFGGVASLPFIHSIAWVYNQITGTDLLSDISEKAGEFSKYALYGVPGGALGVDMSGSLGTDVPTSLADVGGVMTDWAKRSQQTYEDLQAKDYQRAAEDFPLTPQALRGPMTGTRMATRGMEKRSGKDVKDEDFETVKLTHGEVAKKFAGFQPVKLSEVYRKENSAKMIKSYWADKADSIRRQIRLADDKGTDSKEWDAAMSAVDKFNDEIPDYISPIKVRGALSDKVAKRDVRLKESIK